MKIIATTQYPGAKPGKAHASENIGDTNLTYFDMKYKSKKEMDIERGMAAGGSL